jgi:hypothetical protein
LLNADECYPQHSPLPRQKIGAHYLSILPSWKSAYSIALAKTGVKKNWTPPREVATASEQRRFAVARQRPCTELGI